MIADIEPIIVEAISELQTGFQKTINNINGRVRKVLRDLPTDQETGNVLRTQITNEAVNNIVQSSYEAVQAGAYIDRLNKFMRATLDPVDLAIRDQYAILKKPPEVLTIQDQLRTQFSQQLLPDNYFTGVILPVMDMVYPSINEGTSLDALVDQVTSTIQSRTAAYINVSILTPVQLYARNLNDFYRNLRGFQFARYVGPRDERNRDFCHQRAGRVYHQQEIAQWAYLDWEGKIPDTNINNIERYLGGYNCRHILEFIPVSEVPESTLSRARQNNYLR